MCSAQVGADMKVPSWMRSSVEPLARASTAKITNTDAFQFANKRMIVQAVGG